MNLTIKVGFRGVGFCVLFSITIIRVKLAHPCMMGKGVRLMGGVAKG
mgnify:CR=1 FL=1